MAEAQEINLLVEQVKKGSNFAFKSLTELFQPLILSMTERFSDHALPAANAEREDWVQEATIALYKAALRYDTGQNNVTFGLYAKICIRNRLVSVKRHMSRKKRKTRRNSPGYLSASERSRLFPALPDLSGVSDAAARARLSAVEFTVLKLYLSGMRYKEIADHLGCDVKSVDNALTRAKKKLKARITPESEHDL